MSPELRDKIDYYLNYVIIAVLIFGLILYMDHKAINYQWHISTAQITVATPVPVMEGVEHFEL